MKFHLLREHMIHRQAVFIAKNRFATLMLRILGVFTVMIFVLLPSESSADPTDIFGLDARGQGMANTMVSLSTDWSFATHNPAAGAIAEGISLGVGYSYYRLQAKVNGHNAEMTDARGLSLGLVAPFNIYKRIRAAFGITAHLPDYYVVRVQMKPAYEPRFVLLDNRPNRVVLTPAFSLRVWDYLSFGVGATILADATGDGVVFDVGVKGGTKVGEAALDIALPVRAAPVAGLFFGPIKGFAAGIAYRGELDLRLSLDILANVDVAGIVKGDAIIAMRAVNYFTPRKLTAGLSYTWKEKVILAAGISWYNWSSFEGGLPTLRILVDLGLTPPMLGASFPPDNFHDTVTVSAGSEYVHNLERGHEMAFRMGYRFEPSPVPAQIGYSALLDNDRHIMTAGFGYQAEKIAKVFPYQFRLDLALQYHFLVQRTDERTLRWSSPHGTVSYWGHLFGLSLSASVEF